MSKKLTFVDRPYMQAVKKIVAIAFLTIVHCATFSSTTTSIETTMEKTIRADVRTQQDVDKHLQAIERHEKAIRELRLQLPLLELEKKRLERNVEFLTQKNNAMQKAQADYDRAALVIEDDLFRWVADLETVITRDLPFAQTERQKRLTDLKETLHDTDLTVGEKYRRVIEAYGVEADYGLSSEVSTEEVLWGENPTTAHVLRIGRVALYALTIDRKQGAVWSSDQKRFLEMPDSAGILSDLADHIQQKVKHDFIVAPIIRVK